MSWRLSDYKWLQQRYLWTLMTKCQEVAVLRIVWWLSNVIKDSKSSIFCGYVITSMSMFIFKFVQDKKSHSLKAPVIALDIMSSNDYVQRQEGGRSLFIMSPSPFFWESFLFKASQWASSHDWVSESTLYAHSNLITVESSGIIVYQRLQEDPRLPEHNFYKCEMMLIFYLSDSFVRVSK